MPPCTLHPTPYASLQLVLELMSEACARLGACEVLAAVLRVYARGPATAGQEGPCHDRMPVSVARNLIRPLVVPSGSQVGAMYAVWAQELRGLQDAGQVCGQLGVGRGGGVGGAEAQEGDGMDG